MKSRWIIILIFFGVAPAFCSEKSPGPDILSWDEAKQPVVSKSLIRIGLQAADKNGNPARGLKAEDFELYQDGRKQEITEFQEVVRAVDGAEPRIIVFIIDDMGLPRKKFDQVRNAIKYFTDNVMQSGDMAGIARTAGGGVVFQPLTTDAAKLRNAVDRMQWSLQIARSAENVLLAANTSGANFIQSCSGSS